MTIKRTIQVAARLTEEEHKILAQLARRKGIGKAGVLRHALLDMAEREGLRSPEIPHASSGQIKGR